MASQDPASPSIAFPPTMWSRVRLAVAEAEPGADQALDELCRLYERPIHVFILRKGYSPDAAADLKQAFFEHLLSKNAFADASGLNVKLRAFLITKLQSFLIDRHRHEMAAKRGAGKVAAMADLSETQALLAEPVDDRTPIVAFQRQWMETIAANAMKDLREDYAKRGQAALFAALAPFITGKGDASLAELSSKLDRPEGTLKSDISRLRARCQNLIREQVAATLDDPTPENITAELKELMSARMH
ncbi:MAG: RNA polymerase subunit sigma-24 [Verrucomicrobiaceae bacterium]|nr:RNA polymerase subunit sigma-24 [Verrucomicrobiaceae bacterium]